MKPKLVAAPAPSAPFQAAFRTVTVLPDVVNSPDHDVATAPPGGSANVVVHLLIAVRPAVTCTDAW